MEVPAEHIPQLTERARQLATKRTEAWHSITLEDGTPYDIEIMHRPREQRTYCYVYHPYKECFGAGGVDNDKLYDCVELNLTESTQ